VYASEVFGRTWGSLLVLFLIWIGLLIVWLVFKPSLASAMEALSRTEAERYRAIYKILNPLIGRTWAFAGILALTAYGVEVFNWPHPNWLGTTIVPGLRAAAEILIVAAFGQGVDLVLRSASIIEGWIKREKLEGKLGPLQRPLLWFLRNPGVAYSIVLVGLVSTFKYQGAATEMVLGVAGTLILGRLFAGVSRQLSD
jgi:hypothetical protein